MTKNPDIGKYKYSGYGIGFDRHESFSFNNGIGRKVMIFAADMCSSIHVEDKGKDILILKKGPMQGLGEHSLTAETIHLANFTERNKKNFV